MGFFGQVARQVRDLHGRLTFSQKAAFVLLIAVVVAALVMLTNWGSRAEYVRVTHEPLGAERPAVLAALRSAGIDYREVVGALEVAASRTSEATAILATHGIVSTEQINIRLADVGKEDRMFRTSEDKRAQRLVALQNWLSDVISHMENIRAAAVALDVPQTNSFVFKEDRGTAAVHVWLDSSVERLGRDQVNGIAALVAGVRRTIRKSDVSIIDDHGHEYRVPGSEETPGLIGDRQEQQIMYEHRLAGKVRDMLSYLSPVNVMVRLKIDFDSKTEETVDVDPDKVVEVETRREYEDTSAAEGAPEGTAVSKEKHFSKKEIYRKVTRLVKAPGDVQDMSVSVFVPRDRVMEQIRGRGVTVETDTVAGHVTAELERVKTSIANMLLVSDLSRITVQAVTFPTPEALPEPVEMGAVGRIWTTHGRTAVLAVLSLVALFLLWRMVKKPVEVVGAPRQVYEDEEFIRGIAGAPGGSDLRGETVGRRVEDVVRESPRDAANLITRWVQSEG